jgi:mono/diheme cytochrome c family protein
VWLSTDNTLGKVTRVVLLFPRFIATFPVFDMVEIIKMRRQFKNTVTTILNAMAFAFLALPVRAADSFATVLAPAFERHCVKCHGQDGKVDLLQFRDAASLTADPEFVQDLIAVLDAGDMPPETEPALKSGIRKKLVSELKQLLQAAVGETKSFAHTPIRRMNRFQYNNAVQDLFQLNADVFALPERMMREHGTYFRPDTGKMPDNVKVGSRPLGKSQLIGKRLGGVAPFPQDLRAEHGFDNRADHLTLSPLLLESFFRLSQSILDSDDFSPKTCGIWPDFFEPPDVNAELATEVRRRLQSFLTRAFRRPVADDLLNRYTRQVVSRVGADGRFTEAMKGAAAAAMCSPRFLYLYDGAGSGTGVEQLTDLELASRLSFFLWGSGPDKALLEIATQGRLREPAMLEEQTDRLLRDRKLKRFADSFPSQWLQLERIIPSVPDKERYPAFYFAKYRLSMHMMLEPLLLFETVLIENRPILDLIDSNYSYRSDALSAWYADQGKTKSKSPPTVVGFKRLTLTNRHEGGVFTTAAVMTMTSSPVRTQPITRGAWMASVIFNNPPEPPPADVPPLPEDDKNTDHLTIRERLALHRTRVDCAGCHTKIDPLGFALENYDPTGFWRDNYDNGRPVDSSGVLFRRHKFTNIVEFKDALLTEKDRFTRAFAQHLLSFALGRAITAADSPALDRIASETAGHDYRLHPLIKQVVMSEPFRYKSNPTKLTQNAH